ncbi:MAG TPA: roadblock/LC7 domain-containing protein [Gemmatimonadaceae bacterium]|nr:roadblock/LC7 domain-containing protein [Gemmatimonadaceae bacterium]
MPTIRELVGALAQRDGVEGVILLGRDGLIIDGRTAPSLDAEHLAAHVPALVAAADELATHARRGPLVTAVLEYERGYALVSALTNEAVLLVLVHPSANVGSILFDVRRHRGNIASLV